MRGKLIEIEGRALAAMKNREFSKAIELWNELLALEPDWEHGSGHHSLAQCYANSGDLPNARAAFLKAMEIEPRNDMWLGGYASFLYLHDEPAKAMKAYLALHEIERKRKDKIGRKRTLLGIQELARRLNLDASLVEKLSLGEVDETAILSQLKES